MAETLSSHWEKRRLSPEDARSILLSAKPDRIQSANLQVGAWLIDKVLGDTRFSLSDRESAKVYIAKMVDSFSDEKKKEYLLHATREYDELVPLVLIYLTMQGVASDLSLLRQETTILEHALSTKQWELEKREGASLLDHSIF